MKSFYTRLNLYFVLAIFASLFVISCHNGMEAEGGEEEEEGGGNPRYSGPAQMMQLEFDITKDPALGYVPTDRLLAAMDYTRLLKNGDANRIAVNWIERGPDSDVTGPSNGNTRANGAITAGRIRAAIVDSSDASHKTVFVAGVSGGLWKTNDVTTAPANWQLVNDYMDNLAVTSIVQDPSNFSIMYLCTGEAFNNADAVRGVGVFKSTDGGTTWNQLPSTTGFMLCTKIVCDFQGNIYLATNGNGVQRSTNGGTSWTNITPTGLTTSRISDLELSTTASVPRLYMSSGIFSAAFFRYTDNPATVTSASWTEPVTPYPNAVQRCEIAAAGMVLYALPVNGSYQVPTIYKSTDGGANWAATAGQPVSGWASGQGWYSLSAAINPANTEEIFVGGLDSHRSLDGGATWTKMSGWVGLTGQYSHADHHNMQWYDGGNKFIFLNDGGVFYSADKGVTIRDRNAGLRIKQFYSVAMHPTAPDYFLAGAQDNGTHQLKNAGLGASVEVTGGDGAYVDIDQSDPQFQFGAYVYNTYRRSTNGGANWSSFNFSQSIGRFINPFDYDDAANIIYASGGNNVYFRWSDPQTATSVAASTNAYVPLPLLGGNSVSAVKASPYTANKVYFGSGVGRVVAVKDADGATPTSVDITPAGINGNVNCVNVGKDDQKLVAVTSNYGVNNIWISSDGGTSWSASDGNLPDMPVRWALFNPDDNGKMFIATETGVWQTDLLNGASTVWEPETNFPNVRTDMITYRPSDRTIAAGTHGRGVWSAQIPPPVGCNPAVITSQPGNAAVCAGAAVTFTVTASGDAPLTYQWQVSLPGAGTFTNITGATSASYTFTTTAGQDGNQYRAVVTGICGTPATSAPALLTIGSAIINTQPQNVNACAGSSATFTVAASGSSLTYQWQVSTNAGTSYTNIGGATSSTYTIPAVTIAQNNNLYRVIVSSACSGSITSTGAKLTVASDAVITGQPQNAIVCVGANASFTVTATGSSLTYQWQVSAGGAPFSDVVGATGSTLTITAATAAQSGNQYRVLVFSCGPTGTISSVATLTVNTLISLTTQPVPVTTCAGTSASFSVTAAGTGATYQWQYSSTGCSGTFANIAGATSATYTVPNPSPTNNGGYRVVITGTCNTITSACALLVVNTPAAITTQPVDLAICIPINNSATFTVATSGTAVTYQWQVSTNNGTSYTNIAGATSASFTITPITAALNGNLYRVVISNPCTSTFTSAAAKLTVNTQVAITAQPKSTSTCNGDGASFTVVATGTTITYQWQVSINGGPFVNLTNTAPYSGVNTATLTITNAPVDISNYKYRVVVSGVPCGSLNSDVATLTVNQKPAVILTLNNSSSITPYVRTSVQAVVSPAGSYAYKWFKNGVLVPSFTGSQIPLTVDDLGEYYVVVTNTATGCGTTSNKVTLNDAASSVLFVWPNPSQGQFQVRFYNRGGSSVDRTLVLTDARGRRVFTQKYTGLTGPYGQMNVDARVKESGMYNIVVYDASGKKLATSSVIIKSKL